jgi:hypothetical protein
MGLNETALQNLLKDENCLKLLIHCKEPKTYNEIKGAKINQSKIFSVLTDLKLAEALLFDNGKYYTSPDAFKFLE